MRFLCLGLLLISTILSKGRSEDFHCYVCDDCSKVADRDLKKCEIDPQKPPGSTTTTELPPVITTTTTEPPVPQPEKSTTTSTTTTTTTTIEPPVPQPEKNTTTSTTTTTTTIEPPVPQPEKNTTTSTTTTTTTIEPPVPQPEKNTTTSTTTTTTTIKTPTEKNTTTTTTTTTTTPKIEPEAPPAEENTTTTTTTTKASPEVSPAKDFAVDEVDERNEFPEAYSSSIQSAVPQVFRARRSIRANGPSCHCFSMQVKVGDAFIWKRGKITTNDGEDACKKLKEDHPGSKDCKACEKDKCNSSVALQFSFVTLLAILTFSFFA